MNNIASVSQFYHERIEYSGCILQAKCVRRTGIAEPEAWDAWRHNVECLVGASAITWKALGIRERVDNFMNFNE
jgi:hypothetical protein